MALSPSFTISNNATVTSTFQLLDTSTGSDAAIANRILYLYDASNTLFATIQFPLSAGSTISPAILTQDIAYAATLTWVDSGGNVLYQVVGQIGVFTGFLESFNYGLIQQIAANNSILNDVVFKENWGLLVTLIDSAGKAITIGNSIYNSQSMILIAQNLTINSTQNF